MGINLPRGYQETDSERRSAVEADSGRGLEEEGLKDRIENYSQSCWGVF